MRSLIVFTLSLTAAAAEQTPVAVLRYAGPLPTTERLTTAAYSPDGTLVIAASESGQAQVWDTRTLSPRQKCHVDAALTPDRLRPGQSKPDLKWIRDARFSPDGRKVVLAGPHGNAWLWTIADGDCKAQNLVYLNGHTDDVRTAEFSHDGRRILTTSDDGTVRLWDPQGHLIKTLALGAATAPTTAATFSPDDKLAVVGRADGYLAKFDLQACEVKVFREGGAAIRQISFAADGQTLAVALGDGEVALWGVDGHRGRVLIAAGGAGANSVAFSPDGGVVAVGLAAASDPVRDSRLLLLRTSDGALVRAFPGGAESVSRVAFAPDGARIAASHYDGTVRVWNVPH